MMGRDKVLDMIYQNKIIAIIRGVSQENIEDVIQALLDGGVNMAEITFDHTDEIKREETLNSLRKIRKSFGERICLGAGTDGISGGSGYSEAVSGGINGSRIYQSADGTTTSYSYVCSWRSYTREY